MLTEITNVSIESKQFAVEKKKVDISQIYKKEMACLKQ